jgi:hypothetical protein
MELQMFENTYVDFIAEVYSVDCDQENSKELIAEKWDTVILECKAVIDYLGSKMAAEKTKWEKRIIEAQKHKISDHKQKTESWYSIYNIFKGEEERMDEFYRATLEIFESHRSSISKSYPDGWNQVMKQCASSYQDIIDKLQHLPRQDLSEQDSDIAVLINKWQERKEYAQSGMV